jgi:hypothetical protein
MENAPVEASRRRPYSREALFAVAVGLAGTLSLLAGHFLQLW